MVRAQNDLYMVTQEASKNLHGDNLEASLKEGTLTIAELRRCANNIISFLKTTHAQKRMDSKEDIKVEIINRNEAENITDPNEIVYYELGNKVNDFIVVPLENANTSKGSSFTFAIDMKNPGILKVELTGKSNSNKLAQMNVSISTNGIPVTSITFNGTDGEYITKETEVSLWSKYTVTKLFFAESGLELKDIKFTLLKNLEGNPFEGLTEKNDDAD